MKAFISWFPKHLNVTTVIFTICANVVSFFLTGLIGNVTHIPAWGPKYPPGTICVMLPAFSSFYFDLFLIVTTTLLIVWFNWVLTKKKRSWVFLLPFFLFLIFEIPDFLSWIISLRGFFYVLGEFHLLGILLWFIGWIALLSLNDKTKQAIQKEVVMKSPDLS